MVNQADIEHEILRLSELLEEQTHEYGKVLQLSKEAEAAYRIGYARSFTSHRLGGEKVSEETCKQLATQENADLLAHRLSAEAQERYLEEQCRSLRERLGAVRTLSANVRSQT